MASRKHLLVSLFCKAQAYLKTRSVTPLSRVGTIGIFIFLGVFVAARPALANSPSAGDWLMLFVAQISMATAMILMKITVAFLGVIMKLMLYNGFSTSPVVSAGWSVVRDSVNMFYVIILIGVAVGTIFGTSKFKWNQVLPRLLIFAIVINFSKTLCALMIDFGQVIMLTFANAVRQVAAGNFIQTLGLDKIISLSDTQINNSLSEHSDQRGMKAFDLMAAGVAAVFMMIMVLATITALLFILLYRMVMLWVLIVVAPLAWFGGSLKGGGMSVVKQGPEVYAKWWGKFTCAVAIGPIVTFFLWLSLSVAGSGNIAAMEGFSSTSAEENLNPGENFLSIMDSGHLLAFFIGIMLLWAGLEAAMDVCSSEGFIKSALGKAQKSGKTAFKAGGKMTKGGLGLGWRGAKGTAGLGWRGAKGTVKLGAKYGWKGAKIGAKYGWKGAKAGAKGAGWAGKEFWKYKGGDIEDLVSGGTGGKLSRGAAADKLRELGADPNLGSSKLGRFFGVKQRLERQAQKVEGTISGQVERAGEQWGDANTEQKVSRMRELMTARRSGVKLSGHQEREMTSLTMKMMQDKNMQRQLRQSGDVEDIYDAYGDAVKRTYRADEGKMQSVQAFDRANAGVSKRFDVRSQGDIEGLDDASHQLLAELNFVTDEATGVVTATAESLATASSEARDLHDQIKGVKTKYGGGKMDGLTALVGGNFGTDKADLATGGTTVAALAIEQASSRELSTLDPATIAANVRPDSIRKNPNLADHMTRTRSINRDFASGGRGSDEIREIGERLMARSGYDVSSNSVTNKDRLVQAIRENPSILGTLSGYQQEEDMANNGELLEALAEALDTGTLSRATSEIKKDPAANEELYKKVRLALEQRAASGDHDADVKLGRFMSHMDSVEGINKGPGYRTPPPPAPPIAPPPAPPPPAPAPPLPVTADSVAAARRRMTDAQSAAYAQMENRLANLQREFEDAQANLVRRSSDGSRDSDDLAILEEAVARKADAQERQIEQMDSQIRDILS